MKARILMKCVEVSRRIHNVKVEFKPVHPERYIKHVNYKFVNYNFPGTLEFCPETSHYKGELPTVGDEYYVDITPMDNPLNEKEEL